MKLDSLQVGMIGKLTAICSPMKRRVTPLPVIDPGGSADQILARIRKNNLDVKLILLTHGHFDHVLGVPDLLAVYPDLPVYITETDYPEARDGGQFGYKMGPVESVQFYDEGKAPSMWAIWPWTRSAPPATPPAPSH